MTSLVMANAFCKWYVGRNGVPNQVLGLIQAHVALWTRLAAITQTVPPLVDQKYGQNLFTVCRRAAWEFTRSSLTCLEISGA